MTTSPDLLKETPLVRLVEHVITGSERPKLTWSRFRSERYLGFACANCGQRAYFHTERELECNLRARGLTPALAPVPAPGARWAFRDDDWERLDPESQAEYIALILEVI